MGSNLFVFKICMRLITVWLDDTVGVQNVIVAYLLLHSMHQCIISAAVKDCQACQACSGAGALESSFQ